MHTTYWARLFKPLVSDLLSLIRVVLFFREKNVRNYCTAKVPLKFRQNFVTTYVLGRTVLGTSFSFILVFTLISLCIFPLLCKYFSPLRVSLHINAIWGSNKGPVTEKWEKECCNPRIIKREQDLSAYKIQ